MYNFMYKQKINVQRLDLRKIFTRQIDAPIFYVKRPNCEKYKKNVFYYGAILWNDFNTSINKEN